MKRYIDMSGRLLSKAAGGQEMQLWIREGNLHAKAVKTMAMRDEKYVMDAETEVLYEINQTFHEIQNPSPYENLS